MIQVSLFNGFADKNPKPITIREVVEIIRADQRLQVLTENHRRYRAAGDTVRAEAEKQHMPCYSVAVLFSGGKQQKHIVSYTGLSIVDLDHVPGERMAEVLEKVRGDEHTLLAYTTISGEGVRVLFRYKTPSNLPLYGEALQTSLQNNSCEHPEGAPHRGGAVQRTEGVCRGGSLYKHAFLTGNEYYCNLLNLPYDEKCKNATRISGMAHDPEVYYNPDAAPIVVDMAKKPVGRPKRVERLKMTVESCEDAVLRELEQRGVVYEAGSHNKYISDACYMMNRYGVTESDCTKWALERFSDYQTEGNDVTSIVRSCYLQTEEHGTARPPKAEKESRYASIKDIQEWLTENNIRIRHNLITRKREMAPLLSPQGGKTPTSHSVSSPLGGNEGGLGSLELTDQHVNSLYCRFCLDTGRQAKISDFYIIIESDFYPDYHPLKEYLESLPAWDGVTDHIDRLASTVHVTGCTQELHNRFFKKWMVAMVAAWLDDGTTNHEILTYIGEQGKYKTSFMTHLLPPELDKYFAIKHFNHSMSKDDRLALTELALIDLEELDNMRPEAVNLLKAITTITIPESVTSIGESAFWNCESLESINIPKSVTSIGEGVFGGCNSLTAIIVDEGNKVYDSREKCNAIIETNSNTLIQGCSTTIIPESVMSIGSSAFRGCNCLTNITIPKGLTSIGEGVFFGCSNLTSIIIPKSVTSIGEKAFKNSDITYLTILGTLAIEKEAFYRCTQLTDVYCYPEETPPAEDAFGELDLSRITLHVPESAMEAYKNTEPWSWFGKIVAIK